MTEALAHRLDVDPFFEQQRGVRVPQSVQRERWHLGQLDAAHEASTHYVRILS